MLNILCEILGKGAITGVTTNTTYQLLTKGEIDTKEVIFSGLGGMVAAPVVAKKQQH